MTVRAADLRFGTDIPLAIRNLQVLIRNRAADSLETFVNTAALSADDLRNTLIDLVLEWERRYGVAPFITSSISEFDAARLIGHTPDSLALDCIGRTAV